MNYWPGFEIEADHQNMTFKYGTDVFGPVCEQRSLDAIRKSFLDHDAKGPDPVYSIVMNVGRKEDREEIEKHHLCFGVVTYAKGSIGKEPVRSQGHIHAVSKVCDSSTCEVYEIFEGKAIIYMQESGSDDAGKCYAITAYPGDVVVVPPNWVHATVNADPNKHMTFGSWSICDYEFDYKAVRAHSGIAFYPILEENELKWIRNEHYHSASLLECRAADRPKLNIWTDEPIYTQFVKNHDAYELLYAPEKYESFWKEFSK